MLKFIPLKVDVHDIFFRRPAKAFQSYAPSLKSLYIHIRKVVSKTPSISLFISVRLLVRMSMALQHKAMFLPQVRFIRCRGVNMRGEFSLPPQSTKNTQNPFTFTPHCIDRIRIACLCTLLPNQIFYVSCLLQFFCKILCSTTHCCYYCVYDECTY